MGRIAFGLLLEDVECRVGSLLPLANVLPHVRGHFHGFIGVLGEFAVAVHIAGERDVAELGELVGPALRVLVEAPPLVTNEHAGAFARDGVIPRQVPDERLVADFVGDFLRLHGRFSRNNQAAERDASQHATQHG